MGTAAAVLYCLKNPPERGRSLFWFEFFVVPRWVFIGTGRPPPAGGPATEGERETCDINPVGGKGRATGNYMPRFSGGYSGGEGPPPLGGGTQVP